MCVFMSPPPPTPPPPPPPPPPTTTTTPTPTPPTPPTTTTQHHPNINTPEQNTQVQVQVQVHHHHHQPPPPPPPPPPPKSMRTSWCQPRVRRPEPIKFPSRSGSSCIAKTASKGEQVISRSVVIATTGCSGLAPIPLASGMLGGLKASSLPIGQPFSLGSHHLPGRPT